MPWHHSGRARVFSGPIRRHMVRNAYRRITYLPRCRLLGLAGGWSWRTFARNYPARARAVERLDRIYQAVPE